MTIYRKTECIQSYEIWGIYDLLESGPSDPKKMGVIQVLNLFDTLKAQIGPLCPPPRWDKIPSLADFFSLTGPLMCRNLFFDQ